MRIYLLIGALSIMALLTHGYIFGTSDQEIFIPYILNNFDKSLFPYDRLLIQESAKASLFYPAISFLLKYANLELIFFIGFLIAQFLFFVALFKLSKVILKNDKFAFLSLLVFLSPKFIGGTATQTFDNYFGYRLIGTIFLLLAMKCLFEGKIIKASLITCINLFIHPLSVIPSLIYFPSLFTRINKKRVIIAVFLIFISIIIFQSYSNINSIVRIKYFWDREWLNILKDRNSFLFISSWSIYGWASYGVLFLPILVFFRRLSKEQKFILKRLFLGSLFVFVFHFVFTEVIKSPFFTNFQLVRSFNPLTYIGLIMTAFFLSGKSIFQKVVGILTFFSIAANLFFLYLLFGALFIAAEFVKPNELTGPISFIKFSKSAFIAILLPVIAYWIFLNFRTNALNKVVGFPNPESEWKNAQLWARDYTQKSDSFLSDPYLTGFRIYSQRSIVGDIKDGGVNMYSPEFAKKWFLFMQETKNFRTLNEEDFITLKAKYDFSFIIAYNDQIFRFPITYSNSKFIIYKIN